MRAATKMNGRGAIPEPLARSCAREDVSKVAIGRLPERESLQVKFCEKAGDGRESNWTQTASQKTYCFAAEEAEWMLRDAGGTTAARCFARRFPLGKRRKLFICIIFGRSKR